MPLPRGAYLISIWNQAGVFIVDRSPKNKPLKIEDPRYNSHITDLKPLFPDQFQELPYVVARNKNAINLVDLRNRHIQPLIEIKNSDVFLLSAQSSLGCVKNITGILNVHTQGLKYAYVIDGT